MKGERKHFFFTSSLIPHPSSLNFAVCVRLIGLPCVAAPCDVKAVSFWGETNRLLLVGFQTLASVLIIRALLASLNER
jgi:hypothetical protein